MNDQKRLLLFFIISIGFLWLWSALFFKPPVKPPAPKTAAPKMEAAAQPKLPAPPPPVSLPVAQGAKAEEITVEKDLYRITFSTEGGVVKSWVLKNYTDEEGKPLDVVNRAACEQVGYPMQVSLPDSSLATKINSAIFVAKESGGLAASPDQLELDYSDGHNQVRKIFRFTHSYEIHVEASAYDGEKYLPVGLNWPGGFGDHSVAPEMAVASSQAFYENTVDQKIETDRVSTSFVGRWFGSGGKASEGLEVRGSLKLAGLEDSYFAGVFIPDSPGENFQASRQVWTPADWKGPDDKKPRALAAALLATQPGPLNFRLFVGPKALDVLRAVNPPVDGLVDFGWFKMFAEPLFLALRYIYIRLIHNYGWAIVLLTLALTIAMFPLRVSQVRSAQKMQKVAPIIKEIQERYKQYKFNDPRKQRSNEEIMKVYKEHGVNPLGGCLPMAIPILLIWPFYRVLQYAIELRHAPWFGCVKDLSEPDRCYILGIHFPLLVVIMVVAMFVAQKMTPMPTADPGQQRMFMIMPVMFALFFYNLPSGLVLYYLTSSLAGIGQQLVINKFFPALKPAPKGPPPGRPKPPARQPVSVG